MSTKEDLILKFLEKIDAQTEKTEKKVDKVDEKCDNLEKRQIKHESSVNSRLDTYNEQLTIHRKGVDIQAQRNDVQDKLINTNIENVAILFSPSDAKVTVTTLSKVLIIIGKTAVGTLAIIKIVEFINSLI